MTTMTQGHFKLSRHACRRMAERNISRADLAFLERYGETVRMQGYCAWYMPHDISWAPPRLFRLVVIATPQDRVITTYWTGGSVRRLLHKLISRHGRPHVYR
ncbi:MAG: DUF4258 domain-containing protein [Polynucleobacter sp.]|nr:DUF4258 domain-containing protein [Polynucleobacter sp.]